ncbi:MAG: ketopantoate reductase family protein [Chloroflexi bacterium]|nr:ketopantoate reductase family protein [Chloroflexota bacterium]
MRVIIFGAGGIGGAVGGHLARVGHDVVLIARPGHVKAINDNGLRLVTPGQTYVLHVPAVEGPEKISFGPDDVVFLCAKGQHTEEAMRQLRAVTADVPVFCFQNGVRNEELVSRQFPRAYGVMVRIAGVYLTDGEVTCRRDPPGWLTMGCYPSGTDSLLETVAGGLRSAGFLVKVSPDVMRYKWGKLVMAVSNAVYSLTNANRRDVDFIIQATQKEMEGLLAKAGIAWISDEDQAKEWPETVMPLRGQLILKVKDSTWQSLARRQGTVESDFLNGEVVRLARRLGTKAPVNKGLVTLSEEMARKRELPGKYTPAELAALLGISRGT